MRMKIAFVTISIVITLILAEIMLRYVVEPHVTLSYATKIKDNELGYKMAPHIKDIDDNGFRNPEIVEHAEIIALGDSHTYGNGVSSEYSWPQQIGRISNMSTYNFGIAGYGSLQYYRLFEEAIKMKPEHIIVGLYISNDFNDVCRYINNLSYWQQRVESLGFDITPCVLSAKRESRILDIITDLHIYMLIDEGYKYLSNMLKSGKFVDINEGPNPTVIQYNKLSKHGSSVDLNQDSISLGFQITKQIIEEMKTAADLNEIDFSVVLITSKERVYYEFLKDKGYELPDIYHQLIDNENEIYSRLESYFHNQNINFVDTTPYVLESLIEVDNVYSDSNDGHPRENGYKAYAEAVYNCIISDLKPSEGSYCNRVYPVIAN